MKTWIGWFLANSSYILLTKYISVYQSSHWVILWGILMFDLVLINFQLFIRTVNGKLIIDKYAIERTFADYVPQMGIYIMVYYFMTSSFSQITATILLSSKLSQMLGLLYTDKNP